MKLEDRRKRDPLKRKLGNKEPRLFVIATEGEDTEKEYFNWFDPLGLDRPKFRIKVLPTEDSKSAPEYVLQRLDEYTEEFDLKLDDRDPDKNDELWLVIDFDRWRSQKLSTIAREARNKGYSLAVSNPCFEVWLLFHVSQLEDCDKKTGLKCEHFEKRLRKINRSYNKKNPNKEHFWDKRKTAVKRARKNDLENDPKSCHRWPTATGSHVYKLVQKLL
mgnify:CR=1 FL=1